MRTDLMQPLRGLQALRPAGVARTDLRSEETQGAGFESAVDSARSTDRDGIVVELSDTATALLEQQGRGGSGLLGANESDASRPQPMIEDPFEEALEPEIFGDDADESVGPASQLGLSRSADDLGGDDVERYGAADDFGEEGVFQVYGAQGESDADEPAAADDGRPSSPGEELSPEEQKIVAELRARDAEVRAHEAAHMAAGGGLTGGASFTYQVGPDGQRYAIGGEVSIDASPGNTPQETVMKAQRIRAAALAPADPSAQDRAVAAAAARMEANARGDLAQARADEMQQSFSDAIASQDEPVDGAEAAATEAFSFEPVESAGFEPVEETSFEPVEAAPFEPVEASAPAAVEDPFEVDLSELEGADIIGFPGFEETEAADDSGFEPVGFDPESSPRGSDVDLMDLYERITGRSASRTEAVGFTPAEDDTAARLGGRLSGFDGGSAMDAQLTGMNTSLEDAYRAVTNPQAAAYDLVA